MKLITTGAKSKGGHYSPGALVGNTLYISVQLPIDPALAKLCDEGKMEQAQSEEMEQAAKKIVELLPERA